MSIPFALSLSKYVNSAGTDVGFASLLAVALLALLYFAGARETRTLRDQLEDAHDRITSLEARIAQALRNQAAGRGAPAQTGQIPSIPGRPGVVAAPSVAAQPMGSAVARVQREAAAVATVAALPALIGAPSGAGAPSLGSATKLIPSPVAAPQPVSVPSAIPAAAIGMPSEAYPELEDDEYTDDFGPEDTMFVPATASAATANGRSGRGGGAAVASPPRVQFHDDEPDGPPPRRTIPTVSSGPSRPRRFAGRLAGLLAALVVVAIIVVVLLLVTGSPKSNKTSTVATGKTPTSTVAKKKTVLAFNPAKVKVSVLNGTGVVGLAGDVAKEISGSGYTVPTAAVTNAALQTVTATTVGYLPGFKADAFRVAKSLSKASGVAVTTIEPADQSSITSCGTPDASGQEGTCPADVIVTVGSDLNGAASAAGAGN